MSEFIRTNDQSVKKSIHSLEMKFSDVALDTNNREVYFGYLLANKDLISDVVNDKHPIWKLSNNAAKKWLLELTRQPFGLPSVVALNAFNKMSVSLLDDVGQLPIVRREEEIECNDEALTDQQSLLPAHAALLLTNTHSSLSDYECVALSRGGSITKNVNVTEDLSIRRVVSNACTTLRYSSKSLNALIMSLLEGKKSRWTTEELKSHLHTVINEKLSREDPVLGQKVQISFLEKGWYRDMFIEDYIFGLEATSLQGLYALNDLSRHYAIMTAVGQIVMDTINELAN